MYPVTQVGPSATVGAASAVAATVNGASYVLVSNTGSTSAWSDFAFARTAAVPATPLIPVPPGGQILVRQTGNDGYWASSIGGITVTPVERGA